MALIKASQCVSPQLFMFAKCLIGVPCFFLSLTVVLVQEFALSRSVVWLFPNLLASEPHFVLFSCYGS